MNAITARMTCAQDAATNGKIVAAMIRESLRWARVGDVKSGDAFAWYAEFWAVRAAREARKALGETTLRRICSYCRADMGDKDGQGTRGVSHGVCAACMDTLTTKGRQ